MVGVATFLILAGSPQGEIPSDLNCAKLEGPAQKACVLYQNGKLADSYEKAAKCRAASAACNLIWHEIRVRWTNLTLERDKSTRATDGTLRLVPPDGPPLEQPANSQATINPLVPGQTYEAQLVAKDGVTFSVKLTLKQSLNAANHLTLTLPAFPSTRLFHRSGGSAPPGFARMKLVPLSGLAKDRSGDDFELVPGDYEGRSEGGHRPPVHLRVTADESGNLIDLFVAEGQGPPAKGPGAAHAQKEAGVANGAVGVVVSQPEPPKRAFLRRWGPTLILGALFVGAMTYGLIERSRVPDLENTANATCVSPGQKCVDDAQASSRARGHVDIADGAAALLAVGTLGAGALALYF